MYRHLTDFYSDWAYESQRTIHMFEAIADEHFKKSKQENFRSIARLAWHITETIPEMLLHAGIKGLQEIHPSTAQQDVKSLILVYQTTSEAALKALSSQWSDNMLDEKIPMYGDQWKRGAVLSILIRHQSHHRGQLSVLLRQAGRVIPGMYGPTKEEWKNMGMEAMD
ncbi:DinB family protein [Aquirufa rosea]|uniref:Damage-inducible protein DinB n=1 Tax=Aquirufa rosea TaxID=2509241 RepID=A0A4Q1C192_9BACT|nr:DinB family protein [Aquirufa rosea]RXK50923.1 hypothetical protein ESB04_04525 [Aquirufa rosea]